MRVFRHRTWFVVAIVVGGLGQAASSGWAQNGAIPAKPAPSTAPAKKPAKLPDPKNYSLTVSDGLKLKYTYYAGTEGKETVPVVLLHPFNGKRGDMKGLAEYLQEGGYAVYIPDIRGHGESTVIEQGGKKPITLNPNRLGPNDFKKIVAIDLEGLKAVIVKQNNAGNLNVKKLCVVGVEMGATLALNWAAQDWSWEDRGTERQGKDIRGLVLVAPQSVYKNVPAAPALNQKGVKEEVLFLVLAGSKDPKDRTYEATKQFCVQLERAIGLKAKAKDSKHQHPRFTLKEFPTTLQGMKLLDNAQAKIGVGAEAKTPREVVDEFILHAVAERKDEWEQR